MIKGVKRLATDEEKSRLDRDTQLLAAIVESSHDSIVTQNLDGTITSWNTGAELLFGYRADEAIGKSVTMFIPAALRDKESCIQARIRNGERVDHYETVRLRKDGTAIHVSLTVSPLKDGNGEIVGASRIGRDITERKQAEDQRRLLLKEMEHRIKNVFSLASSLITLSANRARTPAQLAEMASGRLEALARAHALTVPSADGADSTAQTTLHELIRTILSPCLDAADDERLRVTGRDFTLSSQAVTPLALVLNELMTNAAKHGALREPSGSISFDCAEQHGHIVLVWTERGASTLEGAPDHEGFGTRLSQITVEKQLGGSIKREWTAQGLRVTMTIDPAYLTPR
ncbi:PAS domain S-box protein [Pseudaminobacter soli (ex Li et al. 2025)]|uniref:Blue-light-activated histidine kinase n=1 Tax=Pseudaminobacter soli (ex Li et al. 2025) TaxID=1295366 RepID=A0A2P7S0R5_9HYPH|nr:PAS domain S-box protein [Mesorhizobium soli]PSJ56058.1 histidine kinase [Mesorhizobium soli]